MADTTPQKRILPARQRRESAAKRRATSPSKPATSPAAPAPSPVTAPTPVGTPSSSSALQTPQEVRTKRKYTKRAHLVHISTPTRSASITTSNPDDIIPTKLASSRPFLVASEAQPEALSSKQYLSIADSAILAASLQRSRMQWLCDGIFKKYWTKPVKRKGIIEQPPNNPDAKSMQKLGNATITLDPHTFDVTFYVVREPVVPPASTYKHPIQSSFKQDPCPPGVVQPPQHPTAHPPIVSNANTSVASPPPKASPAPPQANDERPSPAPVSAQETTTAPPTTPLRPPTPPGPTTKTTDPVIQMLASRAAADNNLKELMKVVATSRATPDQLKEFQAHIDEINGIVKRQDAEKPKEKKNPVKLAGPGPGVQPVARHATTYGSQVHRNSPLGPGPAPGPHFATYPMQPRPELLVKHVVMEFTSPITGQPISNDRWLFPENAVLDLVYGGTEMTCSFFVERKGSDVLASMRNVSSEEMETLTQKWQADTVYYQPVTMVVRSPQHRTIETIARSAKALPDVQKYMQEVMEKKSRAPREFLVYRLPRDKADEFVDSAVELSAEDDEEELRDVYPL